MITIWSTVPSKILESKSCSQQGYLLHISSYSKVIIGSANPQSLLAGGKASRAVDQTASVFHFYHSNKSIQH